MTTDTYHDERVDAAVDELLNWIESTPEWDPSEDGRDLDEGDDEIRHDQNAEDIAGWWMDRIRHAARELERLRQLSGVRPLPRRKKAKKQG